MKLFIALILVLTYLLLLPGAGAGVVHNDSYTTLCAEMDNINIPVTHTNVTRYRITATHPKYYPSSLSEWGADFDDCTFGDRGIWTIGSDDGGYSEFLQGYSFTNGDTYFAQDNPTAGVDEVGTLFPREIGNDWMFSQYIQFTTDEDEDFNLEAKIGSKFTVKLAQVVGTLEMRVQTRGTNGWMDQGAQILDSANRTGVWNIPDLTWMEGTDTNMIHLEVLRAGVSVHTTTNAWAYYDFLELRKRDEAGDNSWDPTVLYSGSNTIVETVHIDFWWRYPEVTTVNVIGGGTDTNVHYVRIKRRMPDSTNWWNEVFVLYEDGNARIIPYPPDGLGNVPYGASVILGSTTNHSRPFAEIDTITVDPNDLSLDVTYGDGSTAHMELRIDRERHIVDVSEVTYNTTNKPFCRFRSMWAHDGKTDIDRVACEAGTFPIMDNWTELQGSWWQFFREVPSYHNTYCPDFRLEVFDPSPAYWSAEAESAPWTANASPALPRTNASSGETLYMSGGGSEALYTNVNLATDQPDSYLLIQYAIMWGGDGIDHLANSIYAVVDGVTTSATVYAVPTGGQNEYELMPSLYLGDLAAGTHQLHLFCGPGTNHLELDTLELISQPSRGWIKRPLLAMECEDFTWATNYEYETRAGGEVVMHMEHAGADQESAVAYDLFFTNAQTSAYLRVNYSDDLGPNKIQVFIDDELRGKFPSETTGTWDAFRDSPVFYLGQISTGWHELKLDVSDQTYGVDLDLFEIYELVDNRSPVIDLSGLPLFPVGVGSNFVLQVSDQDGNDVTVVNPAAPSGSSFVTNFFAWVPAVGDANTTSTVIFVANDQQGLTNSVVTNSGVVVVPSDWDEDGMADSWEWTSFTTLTNEPTGDNDSDGADNYTECVSGTDATSSGSLFALEPVGTQADATNHYITIPTQPERKYTIYFNDQIGLVWNIFASTNAGVWHETNAVASTYTFVDDEGTNTSGSAPANGCRYYKVKVEVRGDN